MEENAFKCVLSFGGIYDGLLAKLLNVCVRLCVCVGGWVLWCSVVSACAQIRLCEQKPFRPRITVGRNKMQHYSCGRWLWFRFAAPFCMPYYLTLLCMCVCVCACVSLSVLSTAGKFLWTLWSGLLHFSSLFTLHGVAIKYSGFYL